MNVQGIADAIAAKYARGTLTPPGGSPTLIGIRSGMATARLPSRIGETPALLVIPESGTFVTGGGQRIGSHTWRALFLYAVAKDKPRETRAVNRWLSVLLAAHSSGSQLGNTLGATFVDVTTTGYTVGTIDYAGETYTGCELELSVTTWEPFAVTAPSASGGIFDPLIFDPLIFDTGGGVTYESVPEAVAAHYARGTLTPPGGSPTLIGIRTATARLPSRIGVTPVVLVTPDTGSLDTGGQTRGGAHVWRAMFLYAPTKDYPREVNAVNRWLEPLLDAHRTDVRLGDTVADIQTTGYSVGQLTYAEKTYTGAELALAVTTTEAWSPTP